MKNLLFDKVEKAKNSSNIGILKDLSNDPAMAVRLAVARNPTTSRETINTLGKDVTSNVVFYALKHPSYSGERRISQFYNVEISRCIPCEKDYHEKNCLNCTIPHRVVLTK